MKTQFEIGDKVSVLDDAIDGVVKKIEKDEISIETTDGFLMTYFVNELIKIYNTNKLEEDIKSFGITKKSIDLNPPKKQNTEKIKTPKQDFGVPEFDLHIEKLVKNKAGMSNYDILNLQAETAKRHLEFAIKNRIPKIVFIHGVGEGVLKAELDFMFGRYENISFRDANYQKYGLGATEIYIKQNAK